MRDFDIEILSLSIIPLDGLFNSKISVSNRDNIAIPIDSIGTGSHTFSYLIDGPLSRIADSQQTLRIAESGSFLVLDIEPNGLLSHNMIVNGEIVLLDSNDNKYVIDVTLTAESDASNSLNQYINPGQLIGLACLFAALWVFLTMRDATQTEVKTIEEPNNITTTETVRVDAWGRVIDD